MTIKHTLGDRMKRYEEVQQGRLMRRTPVIIRLDGKAFHTFTRGLNKPWDDELSNAMVRTMVACCTQIQGAVLGYTQSDEISILLQDWATLDTDGWYDYKVQKMVSVAASIATATFNSGYKHGDRLALFDARVFNVPKEDVNNYFIWRQGDAVRNSISGLAQSKFSHKALQGKNSSQMQDMLHAEFGINWNDTPTRYKRGICFSEKLVMSTEDERPVFRTEVEIDLEIPSFSQDRGYVEQHLVRTIPE